MNKIIYFSVSFLTLIGLILFLGISKKLFVFIGIYIVFVLSFFLLFYVGRIMISTMKKEVVSRKDITKAVFLFIIKNVLVIGTFYVGSKFVGKEIVWGMALYFFQLILFTTAVKMNKPNGQIC